VAHFLKRCNQGLNVVFVRRVEEVGKLSPMLCDKLLQRRHGVLWGNVSKARQRGNVEQRV
jgi:hypothetical protein